MFSDMDFMKTTPGSINGNAGDIFGRRGFVGIDYRLLWLYEGNEVIAYNSSLFDAGDDSQLLAEQAAASSSSSPLSELDPLLEQDRQELLEPAPIVYSGDDLDLLQLLNDPAVVPSEPSPSKKKKKIR